MTAALFDHNLSPCFMASTGAAMMAQSPLFLASPRALTSTHQWMDQPAAIQSKVYKRAAAAINFLLLGVLMRPDGCSLSGSLRCSSTPVFKKSNWPDLHQWGRERGCCQEKIRWRDSGGWWDDIRGLDSNSSAWQQSRSLEEYLVRVSGAGWVLNTAVTEKEMGQGVRTDMVVNRVVGVSLGHNERVWQQTTHLFNVSQETSCFSICYVH